MRDLAESLGLGRLEFGSLRARVLLADAYARTACLRAEEFGPDDREHVWPKGLSIKLQLAGWASLAIGLVLAVFGRMGEVDVVWCLPFLMIGGFLWGTEGPWPLNLLFRKAFMAKLVA